jgi:hypothetical protein
MPALATTVKRLAIDFKGRCSMQAIQNAIAELFHRTAALRTLLKTKQLTLLRGCLWTLTVLASVTAGATSARAGTIVVSNDEWELSDTGFAQASSTGQFVQNLVAELGPKIHAYSNNFGFTGGSLASAMGAAGATYTTGAGIVFDLPTLSSYNAVFLGGTYLSAAQITTLEQYVANGGNVYIAGGTGVGGPAVEADAWNSFLGSFGLSFTSPYNGIAGNIPVSGDPLFNGVSALYQNTATLSPAPTSFAAVPRVCTPSCVKCPSPARSLCWVPVYSASLG